jgi:hypothetical protein
MASFLGKMKNTGVKTKLQGECTLLDREMKARKHKFGVELYDLLRDQEKSAGGGILGHKATAPTPGSFKSLIKEQWELIRRDVVALEEKQEALRLEKVHEEVRRERVTIAVTAKEKFQNAGHAVASRTKETKLMAQIALVDRDILKRKESWGLQIYDVAVAVIGKGNTGFSVKSAVRGGLMKISDQEQKIQQCVELVAREIGTMERSKMTRLKEIDALDDEGTLGNKKRTEV